MTFDEIASEINAFEILLNQTDYQALKYGEGQISEEDYAPIKKQRQEWRDRINELQQMEPEE